MKTIVVLVLIMLSAPLTYAASSVEVRLIDQGPTGSFARGAQRIPMLTLGLTVPCEETVTLDSVTLYREGRGLASDILRVYAVQGIRRVSASAVIAQRDGVVTVRFRRFTLPTCRETILTFAADISPDAIPSSEHRLTLRSLADIDTGDTTVSGSIEPGRTPLRVSPVNEGSISVTYLDLPRVLKFGKQRTVARVRLEADNIGNHNILAINVTNDGKARDGDLQNLGPFNSRGDLLSQILPSLDGDAAQFVLKRPLLLRKNDDLQLSVRADITASRRETIRLLIEEPSDIEAVPAYRT